MRAWTGQEAFCHARSPSKTRSASSLHFSPRDEAGKSNISLRVRLTLAAVAIYVGGGALELSTSLDPASPPPVRAESFAKFPRAHFLLVCTRRFRRRTDLFRMILLSPSSARKEVLLFKLAFFQLDAQILVGWKALPKFCHLLGGLLTVSQEPRKDRACTYVLTVII